MGWNAEVVSKEFKWVCCYKNPDVQSMNWSPHDTWIISLQEHREHPTGIAKWSQL